MLDGVGVARHAAARAHDEAPQREVGRTVVGADQHVGCGGGAGRDWLDRNVGTLLGYAP